MEPTQTERFTALMDRHRLVIERYVHYKMPSSQDAEDVLQETWLAAYTHLDTLTDPAAEKAWLLTIARNQCALWYRKQYRREEIRKQIPVSVPRTSAETILVRSVLAGLPETPHGFCSCITSRDTGRRKSPTDWGFRRGQ